MSCVVGMAHGGQIYMGADCLATFGAVTTDSKSPKVLVSPQGLMLGVVGNSELVDAALPVVMDCQPDSGDEYLWLVSGFVPRLREAFEGRGALMKTHEFHAPGAPGGFLMGLRGRLFYMGSELSVSEPEMEWFAVGSGGEVAMGAMWVMIQQADRGYGHPLDKLRKALSAAHDLCDSVGGKFRFFSSRGEIKP